MILVDVSSILHRMIFGSVKDASKIRKKDGKYITDDFIFLTLHYILSELIDIQKKYRNYGNIVLCFDDYTKTYWRKDFYPGYKSNRKIVREKTTNPINYKEVFEYSNELFDQIRENTPWKCVYVKKAEADDIIIVLAKEFSDEGVLILSPDKDFVQCQRHPNVKQYSSLTKKWITPETKSTDMSQWIYEHVMLGDAADEIPKITDGTEFSDNFKKHLLSKGCNLSVKAFKELPKEEKIKYIKDYDIKLYNKRGEDIGFDLYKQIKFGKSNIKKIQDGTWELKNKIEEIDISLKKLRALKKESNKEDKKVIQEQIKELLLKKKTIKPEEKTVKERINDFLNSHELYKEHYDRNYTLIMEEGIPDYIIANIIMEYNLAKTDYHEEAFNEYLDKNHLGTIKSKLPVVFKPTEDLDITNCGWDF